MTLPMILAMLGMITFNLADTYFVGQLGAIELAAMSFTFPVVFVIFSIAMGLGMGVSAVVARAIGEGNQDKVKRLTTDGLALSFFAVLIFVIAGMLTIEPLFRLLGAGEELIPLIKIYMKIWYPGMLFVIIPMVGNSAIRSTGDTKTPSMIMLVAMFVNIVLDPMLIFGWGFIPRMEIAGAAVATVFARAAALVVSLWYLWRKYDMLSFIQPKIEEFTQSWKSILYIGIPASGTNLIFPLTLGIITRLMAGYGPEAVAGFGVSSRIESFAFVVPMALSAVVGPFVGQNMGANRRDRILQGMKLSNNFSLFWGLLMAAALIPSAKHLGLLFNEDPMVVKVVQDYFLIVSITFGFHSILMIVNPALNAIGKPFPAAMLIIMKMFILYVPLAYLGNIYFKIEGIFIAASISNIGAGIAALFWMKNLVNKTVGERF